MFNKYFVVQIVINKENGTSQEIFAYATEKEAKDKFYDKLSSLGGNPQTKTVRILLLNSDGMQIKDEIIDNTPYIEAPKVEAPTEE